MNVKTLLAIAAISLIGCVANDLPLVTIKGSLNTESVVREHQDIVFETSNEEIRIEVLEIEDARCPSDVTCIWGGYVRVSFQISPVSETIDLVIPPNMPPGPSLNDNYTFTFSGTTYRLVLKDVTPHRTRKNPNAVQSAVFELELI